MSQPTYTEPARWELARAVGLGMTIAGGVGAVLLGGEVFVKQAPVAGVGALVILAVGVGLLLWSRRRLAELWQRNKPYLMSEAGADVLHARRDYAGHALWVARGLLAVFLVVGIVFFFLFSAINCGDRADGFCGQVGRPPEPLVVAVQLIAVGLGCAWAAVVYWRRRHESETERIDVLVAEGQRHRRHDDPMAGTNRFSWE